MQNLKRKKNVLLYIYHSMHIRYLRSHTHIYFYKYTHIYTYNFITFIILEDGTFLFPHFPALHILPSKQWFACMVLKVGCLPVCLSACVVPCSHNILTHTSSMGVHVILDTSGNCKWYWKDIGTILFWINIWGVPVHWNKTVGWKKNSQDEHPV